MVICLEQGADLHMAQLMSLPLTVSCFSKIQIGFTFLVPAHLGSPGQRAIKRVCVVCNSEIPCGCAGTWFLPAYTAIGAGLERGADLHTAQLMPLHSLSLA